MVTKCYHILVTQDFGNVMAPVSNGWTYSDLLRLCFGLTGFMTGSDAAEASGDNVWTWMVVVMVVQVPGLW